MCAFAGTVADDIERIRQVRAVLDPDDVLVADANTGEYPQMRTADEVDTHLARLRVF